MFIYMHVYIYIYIYTHIHIYIYIYIHVQPEHRKTTHDCQECLVEAQVTNHGLWSAFQVGRLLAVCLYVSV